mmetsp:Transcript_11024/g.18429  ORF Transcript_11024/g.18429 Transcript_11024/m.18429 type:complete len:155 (+) Transcript_11024:918-1382(+)
MKFKKGGFFSLKRVKPLVMKYNLETSVSPAYDIIEVLVLAILQLSWSCLTCTIIEMPDFEPNEYLFETHKDKGKEQWEVYAWAVRDAMLKVSTLKECNIPLREKIIYEGYMQMNRKFTSPFPVQGEENQGLTSPSTKVAIKKEEDLKENINTAQ